jgi:hypothetical protein
MNLQQIDIANVKYDIDYLVLMNRPFSDRQEYRVGYFWFSEFDNTVWFQCDDWGIASRYIEKVFELPKL